MRVTTSMYYRNLYAENNKVANQLFDVNKQISSGQKIQYAYENTDVFIKTMRLDDEISTLEQVKKSSNSGLQFSTNTDTTMNDMTTTLDAIKVNLIDAANSGVSSPAKLDAIADELSALRSHMINIANTSINGQHLFSGSAITTKPINDDGTYNGNDADMIAFLGSNIEQKYNITGAELFLGEENGTSRKITTNIQKHNLSLIYPEIMGESNNPDNVTNTTYLLPSDTIRDLVGDTDDNITNQSDTFFYLRGTKSDGTSFKEQFSMSGSETINDLLGKIENTYGSNVVNVELNDYGQIEVTDKLSGSSKLDFHMIAATDFDQTDGNNEADVNDAGAYPATVGSINNLDNGTLLLRDVIDHFDPLSTNPNSNDLLITEFVSSGDVNSATTIDTVSYDRVAFEQNGPTLSSNVAQIVKSDNSFATPSTKLSEVADISKGTADNTDDTLDGTTLNFEGFTVGGAPYTATISLNSAGSTFTLDGGATNYDIFNMQTPRIAVHADEMTYQQLTDVINMVVSGNLPQDSDGSLIFDPDEYDAAIETANYNARTELSSDGKITFQELGSTTTSASIFLYDSTAADFTINVDSDGDLIDDSATASVMTFNSNNALEIRDPKTNFFAVLDEAILAVREGRFGADGSASDPRNSGVQNAIQKIDDLADHVGRQHAKAGVQSQSLQSAIERSETLILSSMILRSDTIDTDIAEASLRLQQLSLNFEAMLSTVSRISQLSLVNYL